MESREQPCPGKGIGPRLAAALLGEGWPHTLPLCLAAGAARELGLPRVEAPFLGLTAAEARWACTVAAALAEAGLAEAALRPWGLELLPRPALWRLLPWGWVEEHALLVARRCLRDGWQALRADGSGKGLLLRREDEAVLLACGPLRGLEEDGVEGLRAKAVVSPLPWEDEGRAPAPVLSPRQLGRWLREALE